MKLADPVFITVLQAQFFNIVLQTQFRISYVRIVGILFLKLYEFCVKMYGFLKKNVRIVRVFSKIVQIFLILATLNLQRLIFKIEVGYTWNYIWFFKI